MQRGPGAVRKDSPPPPLPLLRTAKEESMGRKRVSCVVLECDRCGVDVQERLLRKAGLLPWVP